jgi:hypothetical protein
MRVDLRCGARYIVAAETPHYCMGTGTLESANLVIELVESTKTGVLVRSIE